MWVTENCSTTFWLKIVQLINLWFWLKLEVQMYNMVLSQVLGCSTSKAYTSTMFEAIYIDLKRHNSLHDIQNYSMLQIYWGRDVPQGRPETTWSYHMCLSYTSRVFSGRPCWILSTALHLLLPSDMLAHEFSVPPAYCKCKIPNILRLRRSSSIVCVKTWK